MLPTSTRRLIAPTLAAALLAATTATAVAAPTLSADEIVARNAAARGGLEAWRGIKTLAMTGKMDANKPRSSRPDYHPPLDNPKAAVAKGHFETKPDPAADKVVQLPYRLELKRPHKSRLEIDFNGTTAVQIYDGAHGAKIRPYLGRSTAEPYTPAELELAAQEQELDGPLIDYQRKQTRIAVEGVDPVDGAEAYRLKLTFADGAVRHVWVDAGTFLEVKIDGTRTLDGKPHAVETRLRNYKAFGGLKVATLSETTIQGVPGSSKLTVENVTLNPPLDDGRFVVPPTGAKAGEAAGSKR
ncbi:MAG: outer membrane lipoprotein-sorting protein [Proteobacteria bacterium]|nr:outer membrane lipoprotein-sorting protein [Pseudomonadota bacterium]